MTLCGQQGHSLPVVRIQRQALCEALSAIPRLAREARSQTYHSFPFDDSVSIK